jgi:protein-L-isoaspartate(D-aspartate) O-methyltransferase
MDLEKAQRKLIEHLRHEIRNERVLDAMSRVRRELFVPEACQHLAYEDIPLLIGLGQTISQPFIVALMTEALELRGTEKVLEVGTGSGYQAAILAELAEWVVTVERHQELADRARETLAKLGYTNVEVHLAERTLGWQMDAPYDAIIVTAGALRIPQELLDQLVTGGSIVIPVGSRYEQDLMKVIKWKERLVYHNLGSCRFVPLIESG